MFLKFCLWNHSYLDWLNIFTKNPVPNLYQWKEPKVNALSVWILILLSLSTKLHYGCFMMILVMLLAQLHTYILQCMDYHCPHYFMQIKFQSWWYKGLLEGFAWARKQAYPFKNIFQLFYNLEIKHFHGIFNQNMMSTQDFTSDIHAMKTEPLHCKFTYLLSICF